MGRLVKLVTSVISLAEAFRTPFEGLGPRFLQLTVIEVSASVIFQKYLVVPYNLFHVLSNNHQRTDYGKKFSIQL